MAENKAGFTLVELSIVLVVIGLVVGAVLQGSDMIRSAQVLGTGKQIENLQAATYTFKLKYNCLAGDCRNATLFFGSAAPNGVTDGDGDDMLDSSPTDERAEYFRQLGKAGLIGGNYLGTTPYKEAGLERAPTTKLRELFFVQYIGPTHTGGNYGLPGNYLMLTKDLGAPPYWDSAVTPGEAKMLDTKIDDGIPSKGRILGLPGRGKPFTECSTTDPVAGLSSGTYVLTNSDIGCLIYAKILGP